MPEKYVVVHAVGSTELAPEFTSRDWPLHITLLPTFSSAQAPDDLVRAIDQVSTQTPAFHVRTAGSAQFGTRGDVDVALVAREPAILDLHAKLLAAVLDGGAILDRADYTGHGFRPHVTERHDAAVADGQLIVVDSVSLVLMGADGDPSLRRLVRTLRLPESAPQPDPRAR